MCFYDKDYDFGLEDNFCDAQALRLVITWRSPKQYLSFLGLCTISNLKPTKKRDEGVYHIVRDIQMICPKEFETLVPVMGSFHLVKIVLKCMGKYLSASGADTVWLQAGVFSPTIYLRWCSVYLEDMRRLPETAPSVYENFSSGNFSIKDKAGRFTAIGVTRNWNRVSTSHLNAVMESSGIPNRSRMWPSGTWFTMKWWQWRT